MLVNVRLTYILIAGSNYISRGQVILTVSFLMSLHFDRPRNTFSNIKRTRPNEAFINTLTKIMAKPKLSC